MLREQLKIVNMDCATGREKNQMNKFQYKMTIIMPSYNNGQYIRQALDSILMQEVDFDYQIIITDDCSQDDSPEIIKEYESKYPEKILALYAEENCRLFRNVLKALKEMDSEYFCVLDPDDYWTDKKRLQKAVDFLDKNQEYTIYATNLHKIFPDGSVGMKYCLPGVQTHTSTYEDYIHGKAILSCTPSSTYRNIYFSDGIPKEYMDLIDSPYEEIFRADTARNIIHLTRGKAYFVNESVGCCRVYGTGLYSSMAAYERAITVAYADIAFWQFFKKKDEAEHISFVSKFFKDAIKEILLETVSGTIPKLSEKYKTYFQTVSEWLQAHRVVKKGGRIPFSLRKFGELWDKTVYIWGTGSGAHKLLEECGIPIGDNTFFVDNNPEKQGKEFMGRLVKKPECIRDAQDCLVVIASSYYMEIIEQIREQKLCEDDRIVNIYDFKENWIG